MPRLIILKRLYLINRVTVYAFQKIFRNGSVWVETANGKIKNAGINFF